MDSRKNQSSVLCACGVLSLVIAPSTSADIVGVEAEVRTDLTICQDTAQEYIEEPLAVCNFFAVFDEPTDILLAFDDADITTADAEGFFQHPFGGGDTSPTCFLLPVFPDLVCDSFVTIGVECDDGNDGTTTDPSFDSNEFNNNGHVLGGWINPNWPNDQGDAGTYPNNRVLFLQLSMTPGESVSGQVDLYWCDASCSAGGGEIFVVEDVWLECSRRAECPADFDGSGNVGAPDLALLLGSWGLCPGCPADLDNDGDVDAADLAQLLGSWGPCQ